MEKQSFIVNGEFEGEKLLVSVNSEMVLLEREIKVLIKKVSKVGGVLRSGEFCKPCLQCSMKFKGRSLFRENRDHKRKELLIILSTKGE